ncbi:MAG: hypothetical protein K5640_03110 [Treponema sp.]|nr:hypothetical protein [Treponema sp.]
MKKRLFAFIFIISLANIATRYTAAQNAAQVSAAQNASGQKLNVNFYGVYSNSGDKSMLEMTRNLYFAQLKEMENVTVADKSSAAFFSTENGELQIMLPETPSENSTVSFFVEIETSGNGKWQSILHANSENSEKKIKLKKDYTSYYKILTEAKTAISETLALYTSQTEYSELAKPASGTSAASSASASAAAIEQNQTAAKTAHTTTEAIAGTWHGEDFIDKIVILRGGRGFIIYKNGATMNINISITSDSGEGSTINITQAGKPNASFFPELSRKTALENAPNAEPLEWQLTLTDSNTMQGSKKTLIEDENSPSGASQGTASVTWVRK